MPIFQYRQRHLEIVGTKEYRKPEWVTHMEEMQAALKGMFSWTFDMLRIHSLDFEIFFFKI